MRKKPGFDLLNSILLNYPDVNSEWLLTGKGSMMRNEIEILSEPIAPYGKSIKEILKEKDERIEELRKLLRLKGKGWG
ncbi:MAG: hypothetical protein JJU28_05965 [Cyclobacteriaceae bacterium]|nr:hypothetical protein [Cyclobacteriaceae bacterium]